VTCKKTLVHSFFRFLKGFSHTTQKAAVVTTSSTGGSLLVDCAPDRTKVQEKYMESDKMVCPTRHQRKHVWTSHTHFRQERFFQGSLLFLFRD